MTVSWKARCEMIGLTQVRLAELAGVSKFTVLRFIAGSSDIYASNERAIVEALEAEERRVLAHLDALHPSPVTAAPRHPLPERERDAPHLNGVAA
jgi:predicted transcriptional regulator